MDNLKGNLFFLCPQNEIGMCCRAKWITDNEQRHVISCGIVENLIGELFD